jgi:hypothetical protein
MIMSPGPARADADDGTAAKPFIPTVAGAVARRDRSCGCVSLPDAPYAAPHPILKLRVLRDGRKRHNCVACLAERHEGSSEGPGHAHWGEDVSMQLPAAPVIDAPDAEEWPESPGAAAPPPLAGGADFDRPFPCDTCNAYFRNAAHWQRHQRAHAWGKVLRCSCCGIEFDPQIQLLFHLRVHTGEQPYTCDVCGAAFMLASAIQTHASPRASCRAAVQVRLVSRRVRVINQPDDTQANAHGGPTVQVRRVSRDIYTVGGADESRAHAYRGAALQVRLVRRGVFDQLDARYACAHAHGRAPLLLQRVRRGVCQVRRKCKHKYKYKIYL